MSAKPTNSEDPDSRLEAVLADYLRAAESGQPLDQQQLIEQHPELADELRSFFGNREVLDRIAAPLKRSADDPTLDVGPAGSLLPVAPDCT